MNRILSILLLSVTALVLLGVLMLYSATLTDKAPHRFYAHLVWLAVGVACGLGAALIDYRKLRQFHLTWFLLLLAVLLLVAVFIPGVGVRVNGARRWLPFGGQPSELAKLGLIVWLSSYGDTHAPRMEQAREGFVRPSLVWGLTAGLVFIEPDWGTAALLAAISLAMLLLAGVRWLWIFAVLGTALPAFAWMVRYDPVHLARVLSFLDPEKYQDGIGWQGWHSVLSIGLGGIWGTLCGEGKLKYGFVPEQETDFIFSLVGEELGLLGTTAVVLLFSTIILCGMRIVWRTTDRFGQLLAGGLTILIGLQAFINIGVCTSSLPNKGIPLPFVSYGGSSLICMLVAVGWLVSVARHAPVGPVYAAIKPSPAGPSPFGGSPVASPHKHVAMELASILLKTPPKRWSRVVSWLRKYRASRHPSLAAHPYQAPPRQRNPFAES